MIVLSDIPYNDSLSSKDIKRFNSACEIHGVTVREIPIHFELAENLVNALSSLPESKNNETVVLNGYIPDNQRYTDIYNALASKGYTLINTPEESQRVMEFEKAYPLLESWTPKTVTIRDLDSLENSLENLRAPYFIKGNVGSLKHHGLSKCVANNIEEAVCIGEKLLGMEFHSRGTLVIREFVELKHETQSEIGFPMGREFRVFLYKDQVVSHGYYWGSDDAQGNLTDIEETEVLELSIKASKALGASYVAIDIGQTTAGDWIVIEPGDGQFAGFNTINLLSLIYSLKTLVDKGS